MPDGGWGHAPVAMYSSDPDHRPLPGVWISGKVGERLFETQRLSLPEVQKQLNESHKFRAPDLGILAHLQWESGIDSGKLINVLGFVPGHDPILQDETVIIGAHRDHFWPASRIVIPGSR